MNRPARVLQVLMCDEFAGTELAIATLVERFDPDLVHSTVVTLAPPGPVVERLQARGVDARSLGGRGLPIAMLRLARVIRAGRFDVVNAYGSRATMAVRFIVPLLSPGARVVAGVRGLHVLGISRGEGAVSRLVMAAERATQRLVAVYDANSAGAADALVDAGIHRDRVRVIGNGIDLGAWPRADSRKQSDPPAIVCVARFRPLKRHADLVRACALLRARDIGFELVLVGDGDLRAETEALVDSLDLASATEFAGRVDPSELHSYLAKASVFCLPSLREGMPNSVLEAMASGLPVVGTAVNGIADLVEHDRTGVLVPPGRPDLLAGAIEGLLLDPARAVRFGAAGRQRVEAHFTLNRVAEAKQEMYGSLARTRGVTA